MIGAPQILLPHPDIASDLLARHGQKIARLCHQITRNQSKQIRGLRPRVMPLRPMRSRLRVLALGCWIAIAQKHWKGVFGRAHPHRIDRQDIGPVGEEGDPAKALSLALSAQHPARGIEPHQLCVLARVNLGHNLQRMRIA